MRVSKIIIGACRLIFIVDAVFLLCIGQWANCLALLGSLLLTFLPEACTWLKKIRIPMNACMCYVIFVFCCQWLGTYLRFYDKFFWWDILLHFSSGFLLGYIGLVILMSLDSSYVLFKAKKYLVIAAFVFTFSVMCAAVWEICEYTADQVLGTFTQLGSLKDTMEDIICGTVSAFLFAVYTYRVLKKEENSYVRSLMRLNEDTEAKIKN